MNIGSEDDVALRSVTVNRGQLECLRLVSQNYSSKEIARRLGISRFTVDQRLRFACQKLGVASRFEAARLVGSEVPAPPYEGFVYQPSYIAEPTEPGMMTASSSPPGLLPDAEFSYAETYELRDAQGYYAGIPGVPHQGSFTWPNPFIGGGANDLTFLQRIFWIAALAILSAMAFGAFATGLEALSRLT